MPTGIGTTLPDPLEVAVVDACVAVKWVVLEPGSEAAWQLLGPATSLLAPAHWLAEAINALWAKCIRGELTEHEAGTRADFLTHLPLTLTALDVLTPGALSLALRLRITMYDAFYLALAVQQAVPLVTADRRLFEAARRDAGLQSLVLWLDSIASSPQGGH